MSRQSAKRSMNRAVASVLENLEARRLLTAGNLEGSGTRDILGIDEARGIASNPANDIFVAGQASNRFGVAKFNAAGASIGGNSAVIGSGAQASAIVASNSTVYVGGLVGTSNLNFAIQRFDASTLATVGSVVTTDFSGGTDRIRAMLLLPGDRLLAVGESSDNFALAMYDATSLSLIASFGTAERQVIPSAAIDTVGGVVYDAANDRIVLAGSTAGVLTLRAFDANTGADLATYSTGINASAAGIQMSGTDFVLAANDGSATQILKVASTLLSHTLSAPTSGDATGITVQSHDGRIAISVNDGITQKLVRFNSDLTFDSSDLLDASGAVSIPAGAQGTAGLIQFSTSSTRRIAVATTTSSDDFGLTVFDANIDPVVGTNASPINVSAGGSRALNSALLQITDADDSLASGFIFTVTQLPTNGTLTKAGVPLTIGQTFTQADVDNGLIAYNNTSGLTDNFTFTATDSFGGDVGGLTPATTTVSFNITVPTTVWVDDNWDIVNDLGAPGLSNGDIVADTGADEWNTSVPTLVFGVDAFASITNAISAVASGGTVNVLSGTYAEIVTLPSTKPDLKLQGRYFGVDARTRTASDESVITAPTDGPTTNDLVLINGNNQTVDGFTVDGDNSSITGAVNAASGIVTFNSSGARVTINAATVKNNVVRNVNYDGIDIWNASGGASTGHTVTQNLITGFGNADPNSANFAGIFVGENAYTNVTDNKVIDTTGNTGIWVEDFYLTTGTVNVTGNDLTVAEDGFGIHLNQAYSPAAGGITINIGANTIQRAAGTGGTYTRGINLWSIGGAFVSLNNNTVGATGGTFIRGINVWNVGNDTVAITGGSIGNSNIGLAFDAIDAFYGAGAASTVSVNGLTITNTNLGIQVDNAPISPAPLFGSNIPNASMRLNLTNVTINSSTTGISVTDTADAFTASINLASNNSITTSTTGIQLDGPGAVLVGNTLANTVFQDQTSDYLTLRNTAHSGTIVDAGIATFDGLLGSSSGAALEDKIVHRIDDAGVGLVEWVDNTIFVTDTATPTPTNNDYTRINNAIFAASNGYTINLVGSFNWAESNAAASWATGSDYNPTTTSDNFRIKVPGGLSGVTLTAPGGLGTATVQGPGDLATTNFEAFLRFDGGANSSSDNQNWTISNLTLLDFDLAIAFFNSSAGTDAFNNTTITNNFIRVPADLNPIVAPADISQNIAIHYSFGSNQTISGNTIQIVGSGASSGSNFSSSAGLQSNTSGGSVYDGLLIDNNTINVTGTLNTEPSVILGFWENAHGHTSNITVSNNAFNNLTGPNATSNLMRAFRVTSHSSSSTSVQYLNNSANGANIAFQWLAGANFSTHAPIILTNNLISTANTGYLIQSNGSAIISNGSVSGASGVGVDITAGSSATVTGVSLQNLDIAIRVAGSANLTSNNFNAGTDNATDIQLLSSAGPTTIGAGNLFGGSNYFIDNASTNAFDLTSYSATNFEGLDNSSLTDAFTIEDRIRHALDLSSAGLIRVQSGQLFITNPGTGLSDESIQNAVDAASSGDTLFIQGGANPHAPTTVSANPVAGYPGQLVNITKTLTLQGVGSPIVSSASASASASPGRAMFNVAAPNVTFKDLQLEVDRTKTQVGIQAFENFAGLNIDNLLIRAQGGSPGSQYQPPALVGSSPPSSAGVFVYNLSGTGAPAVTINDSELVYGNYPTAPTLADPFFLRPLSLWGVSATVTNNLLTGTGADAQLVNLGTSTITGNTLPSAGITLVGRQANATITLSSNTFDQPDAGPFPTASLIIRDVQVNDAGGVIVQNNTFSNVRSNRPAIISGRSEDITISGNTFSAASGASNFSYINIASSYPTTGLVSPGDNSVTIQGNTFNAGNGTALLFENGIASSTWGPINVGGAGALANTFSSGLAEFIRLATTKSTYNAGTTNLPFEIDLNITGNQFDVGSGLERPDALSWSIADSFALEAKAFHKIDNASVGLLTWVPDTLFVIPVLTPSATTNDYTVIASALDIAQNNWTIHVGKNGTDATFNWDESNARASWELGNDATANSDDDWSALIRSGLNGLTITANLSDAISIKGPGDLTSTSLEAGFLAYLGGSNTDLTIENFKIEGIDNAIGLYYSGANGGSNFSGLTIQNMHIVVPADNDTEPSDFQNIGIHYALGQNISIVNNTIDLVGSGTGADAQSVGIQSNTHGGANYNGLNISGNTFNVLIAGSEGILGLWENGHAHASNITIENNTFNGDGRADSTAILVTSHSGASTTVEYKDNTIDAFETGIEWLDSYAGTPQDYTGTNAVKLTGNTITDSGTAIKIGGIQAKADLVNNNFNAGTDNQTDVFIAALSGTITFGTGNQFGGDQYFINNESAQPINLTSYGTGNFEGLDKATLAGAFGIENRLRHAPDLASAGLIRVNAGQVYVTTPNAELGISDETIQRAINAANAGDTVNVQDGTYVEQLDITKNLTLDGQSRAGVIIQAPATLGLGNSFTYGQVRQPVVGIRSNATVTLQDLTVDGDGRGGAVVSGNDFVGIGVHNSNATIDNVTVTGVRDSTLNGIQRGRAIFVGNNSGLPRSIEISNSSILDYQKNGIDVRGANITVDIDNNQITGAGATPLIAQNGIVLLDGAGGSISGNDVSNHRYTGVGAVSTGMLLWNAPSGTTITNNTISSNDVSVTIEQSSVVDVTNNTITASDIGVRLSGSAQATLAGNSFDAAVDNKTDVRINSTAGAVTFAAGNQFAGDDLFIDLRSTQNIDLASLGYGAANYEGLNPASLADAFSIEDKIIHRLDVGNTSAGLIRVVNGQLFVTTPGTGLSNESIQNAVDAASAGDTVHVQAGTFDEQIVISKSITLLGDNRFISPNPTLAGRVPESFINPSTGAAIRVFGTGLTVEVRGFQLQGPGGSFVQQAAGTGNNSLTFAKNYVSGGNQMYVDDQALGTTTLLVDDSFFSDSTGNAMQLHGGNGALNVTVTNNRIVNPNNAGINTDSITNSLISGNTFTNTDQQALQVAGASGNVIISGNTFAGNNTDLDNNRGAVRIRSNSYTGPLSITGNTFTNNYNAIAIAAGESVAGKAITIDSNTITTSAAPTGGKFFIVHNGTGTLDLTGSSNTVDAVVASNAGALSDQFFIEDRIRHAPDVAGAGLVRIKSGEVYVTTPGTGESNESIQNAVDAANAGDTVHVEAGTYVENVVVNKNLSLLSASGRATTTIQGISGVGAFGTLLVTNNTTAFNLGSATGNGFTVIGIDNNTPGLESAAVYFQGGHSGANIRHNDIRANGDGGLLTEFGLPITNFLIDNNIFSGQTFLGSNPAGVGFGAQFDLPNVPRQLVVIGSGAGTTSSSNIQFTNNQITGTAGGLSVTDNAGNPISPAEQGNGLVTIDAIGSTFTGNTFSGTTTRFGASLRARGANNTISGNTFNSSTMGAQTTELFIQRAGNVISNNTFTSSAGVGIDVAGSASPNNGGATITNNSIDVAGVGIRTNANTSTTIRGNNLNGNAIGVLVAGGSVDLGTSIDAGNNDFSGYTSPASSSSGAIVVASNDSLAGPQGSPLDITAFGNVWATPTPAGIENVIFHDADDSARRFVDYAGLALVSADVVEASINEGGLATFNINFTNDPQAHTLIIDWGDGTIQTVNLASGIFSASLTHSYVDDNPTGTSSDGYTVSWTLTDSSSPTAGTLSGSDSLVVNNVAPTLTITSVTASIDENGVATLVATVVDPAATEVFAFEIDWADPNSTGVTLIAGLLSSASSSGTVGNTAYVWDHTTRQITLTHLYSDDGVTPGNATGFDVSSVALTVRDDDLGSDTKSTNVTVNNVAPTSLAVTPDVGNVYNEGSPISFTLSASDNSADVLGYAWSVSGPGLLAPITGTGALVTFTPPDNGDYTISYTVNDDDTGVATAVYAVPTIGNVAPVLTSINVTPTTLNEGASVTITGTYTDIGSADSHTLELDLDGDGVFEITGVTVSGGSFSYTHTYTDDNPTGTSSDPRDIKVRVRDDDALQSNELSQSVTVNNVAPTPTITGIFAGNEGSSFNFGSSVVDPGTDTFSYLWTVTKNSLPYAVVGNTSPTFSFVPDNSGPGAVWVVTLQVTDDDGGVNTTSQTLTVNDVAPTLSISPATQSINESTLASITLSDLVDPGLGDLSAILSLSVTWGDGNFTTLSLAQLNLLRDGNPLTTVTLTHVYADDATVGTSSDVYTIEVNVTTSNKGIYSNIGPVTAVTVNNLNPDGFIALPIPGTLPALTNRPVDVVGLSDPSALDIATLRFAFGVENTLGGNGIFDAGDLVFGGLDWLTGTTSSGVSLPGSSFPTAGTYRIFVRIMDDDNGFTDKSILVNVSPLSFRVSSFDWTDSGFDVVFNRPFAKTGLNIYGTAPSDLLVTRDPDGSGPLPAERVFGSLVWDGINADRLTFVRTGGVLQPGTYAVTIVSGSSAFRDQIGSPSPFSFLDGNNDNVGGDNYVATPYVLGASSSRIVAFGTTTGLETNRFRDMSRGPGQPLAIPVGASGLPLRINDGTGVVSFDFTLRYDPDLLTINALTLPPGLPGAWNITTNVVSPGVINVAIFGDTPLTAGARVFLLVDAVVPATATYRDSHVVRLDNLLVNGGAISARSDHMVHSVNLLGDANGNGNYTGFDATLISQVAVGLRTHFNDGPANFAFPLTDPVVIADVDGSQTLTAFDAARVNSEAVGIDVPEIPTPPLFGRLPVSSTAPSANGGAATAFIRAGESSMIATGRKSNTIESASQLVPLNVRQSAIAGAASAFTFEVNFEASRLRINPSTDLLSTELSRSLGLTIVGNLIAPGRLLVVAYGAQIGMPAIGTLINARFSSIDASTTTVQVRAIHEAMGSQDALTLTSAHTLRFTRVATREGATAMLFSGESIL